MAINLQPPATTTAPSSANNLFAAVDMGTNSFKLLIVHADPATGRFLALDRLKSPVLLGRDSPSASICAPSQLRAAEALRHFQQILHLRRVPPSHSRFVATSAVREASNQSSFLRHIFETLGLQIDVLSGQEEARLIYLGILQFHPVHDSTVLTIDIGGGSTEFVIGKKGNVLFATSLKLGHVTLTQQFVNNNEIEAMRQHIRGVLKESGLIEKVSEYGFDTAIGSSGTIRAIEKAVLFGYKRDLANLGDGEELFAGYRRDWRFSREELGGLVEKLCGEEERDSRREGFFKRRSEFIVAGAVLLEEILGTLGVEELEVSGYALGEGVIAEKLAEVFDGYDWSANARWRSVVRLATRFNNKKRMKTAAICAGIAKVLVVSTFDWELQILCCCMKSLLAYSLMQEIFVGLRKLNEESYDRKELIVSLDDKDLEYLEAACLLHSIGLFMGRKGYHKQSYHIITNGNQLQGYDTKEVKLIALLARHHRKKFPKDDLLALEGFTKEEKQKFRILCVIVRLSAVIEQYQSLIIQEIELSDSLEGYKLVRLNSGGMPHLVLLFSRQSFKTLIRMTYFNQKDNQEIFSP
ncbi:hypothetical protein RJ640_013730 [Escallonia rubra]|uniref:Exopolyphosphatase n=1 Tax=Escallonia rubra TaxID=112253 RepID=A0AA88QYT9_9ASTE|nr:hypothetical protein RJ640_013730 [Escallonia rubra]